MFPKNECRHAERVPAELEHFELVEALDNLSDYFAFKNLL
jgi:hypothetical protein